jgi:hypothetical protein
LGEGIFKPSDIVDDEDGNDTNTDGELYDNLNELNQERGNDFNTIQVGMLSSGKNKSTSLTSKQTEMGYKTGRYGPQSQTEMSNIQTVGDRTQKKRGG